MKMEAGIYSYSILHRMVVYRLLTVCRLALKRILSFGGYELPAGQGFHITRKTFATRLLEALNKIDDISNALGHVRKETSEVYLERDEAGMRLCPIRFGSVSVC